MQDVCASLEVCAAAKLHAKQISVRNALTSHEKTERAEDALVAVGGKTAHLDTAQQSDAACANFQCGKQGDIQAEVARGERMGDAAAAHEKRSFLQWEAIEYRRAVRDALQVSRGVTLGGVQDTVSKTILRHLYSTPREYLDHEVLSQDEEEEEECWARRNAAITGASSKLSFKGLVGLHSRSARF